MAKFRESRATYSAEPITVVTARGETEIPRALRERYRVGPRSRLRWVDTGKGLLVIPTDGRQRGKEATNARSLKRKKPQTIRPENRAAIRILRQWMREPDDWTSEQWDEFEQELRTRRLSLRKSQ